MPAAVICPKCQKHQRSENHICQPSALKKLKPLFEAQRRTQQVNRR
jgi:predicted nucleic-acid-binding Zn-ribbon protein